MEENYCLSSSAAGVLGDQSWAGNSPLSISKCQPPARGCCRHWSLITRDELLSCSPARAVWCSRHSISNTLILAVLSITASHSTTLFPVEKKRTCIVKKEWKCFLDGTLLNKPLLVRVHKCLATKEICWEKIEYTALSASWATPQLIFYKFKASDGIYKINK